MTGKTPECSLVFFFSLFPLNLLFRSRIWDCLLVFLDPCHLPYHQSLVSITHAQVLILCALIPPLGNDKVSPLLLQEITGMAQA